MRRIEYLLSTYGNSHQNPVNKLIHWICIPAILFSLTGMLLLIPLPSLNVNPFINLGSVILLLAALYYIRLSFSLTLGFVIVFGTIVLVNLWLAEYCLIHHYSSFYVLLSIFILAWLGQFYGHKIEGKKPSFLEDIQYLLVGPMWLLHFLYKKIGIPY